MKLKKVQNEAVKKIVGVCNEYQRNIIDFEILNNRVLMYLADVEDEVQDESKY